MCPGSMPLYGVSTSSVQGSPTVHVDALEIWLTLLVGELFHLFFEVINTFTFFKPEKTTTNTQKSQPFENPYPFFPLFETYLWKKALLWSMSPVHQAWVPYPTSAGHGHVNVHHPPRLSLWWWESWPHVVMLRKKMLCTMTEIDCTKFHQCWPHWDASVSPHQIMGTVSFRGCRLTGKQNKASLFS